MPIELVPLCTIEVDVAPPHDIGTTPAGARSVGDITGAKVSGERLNGELAGSAAADWMIRSGDLGIIDVRMTLRTDDNALIFVEYGGRLDLSSPQTGIVAYVAPVFETGDERYAWLNRIQAVGKGTLSLSATGARIHYELYEVR